MTRIWRLPLVLLCLGLCACSGYDTSSGDDDDTNDNGDTGGVDGFDLLPVRDYDGDPMTVAVGGNAAEDLSFAIDDRGVIDGTVRLSVDNDDGSTTTRSYGFDGTVTSLRFGLVEENLTIYFSFAADGDFDATATAFVPAADNRAGERLITGFFISGPEADPLSLLHNDG